MRVILPSFILGLALSAHAQFNDLNDPGFVAGLSTQQFPAGVSTGLVLWFKPEALSGNNGDTLTIWNDSSGNNWHARDTNGSNGPMLTNSILNGYAGIAFGASTGKRLIVTNTAALSAFSAKDGCTLFSVVKRNAANPSDAYWFDAAAAGTVPTFRLLESAGTHYFYSNKGDAGGFTSISGMPVGFNILTHRAQWTNVTLSYHLNGGAASTFTLPGSGQQSSATAMGHIDLGHDITTGQYSLNGWLVELIAYSTVLSTNDRGRVEVYLKAKYGL